MGPSAGRYLAARAIVGGAVAILLALPASGAHGVLSPAVLTLVVASSLAGGWVLRARPARIQLLLMATLAADLMVESVLVATTGASRSPFALLFSLTIAASGLFFRLQGSMVVTFCAMAGYWAGTLLAGSVAEGAPVLTSLFLLLLGLLTGLLGRRVADQSREVDRVRVELERVLLDAETIVASLESPLLCLDREGEVRRANRTAARLLRVNGDLEGRRLEEVGAHARIAPLLDLVEKAFRDGMESSTEILLPGDGAASATPVEVLASCVRDRFGAVRGLVLLLNDLTRRKEQEAEQARRERLAVIGEMSGHLAHEIRNSLKPVVGSIELLAGEIPQEGIKGELMGIILRESEALETFLSDFLTYARDKTLTIEDLDLDELIKDQIAALSRHPACSPGVSIRSDPGPVGTAVRADRRALRDILRNLLLNALEATPEGEVSLSFTVDAGNVELTVSDTGVGLPEGDPESLFEPFCSHKPGGTGLGLSIARRLARRLGGDVILERRQGPGACARLSLRSFGVERRAA